MIVWPDLETMAQHTAHHSLQAHRVRLSQTIMHRQERYQQEYFL